MIEEHKVYFERYGAVISGITYIIPENSIYNFKCGLSIFVPDECLTDTTILMHACNTGGKSLIEGANAYHLADANEASKRLSYSRPNSLMWVASELKMPIITPLIPRVVGYYAQALGSSIRNNDLSGLISDQINRNEKDQLSPSEIEQIRLQCFDIPEQIVEMIKYTKKFLGNKGITVDDKVIAEGYSAGSKFVNAFTALYPNYVKAVICGGNSGLGIIPLKELNGTKLKFPLGVSDIDEFDEDAFKNVAQLYYIGSEDDNDPAMPECYYEVDDNGEYIINIDGTRTPKKDEFGNLVKKINEEGKPYPRYKDCYTQEEFEIIHNLLGENVKKRFYNIYIYLICHFLHPYPINK